MCGRTGVVYDGMGYTEAYLEQFHVFYLCRHLNQKYLPINARLCGSINQFIEREGLTERIMQQSISLNSRTDFLGNSLKISDLIPRICSGAHSD